MRLDGERAPDADWSVVRKSDAMNATSTSELMNTLGSQAKAASALMAKAGAATKVRALRELARLLRENVAPLQVENAKDLERARAAGLAEPMVDRLKLTPKVLETCAEGCEQLAAMPDIIGEIMGMKQQPSGIRVGQMRVPIGVFGMIYESRPNVTIEAASLAIKSGNACILRGGSEALQSNLALWREVQAALRAEGWAEVPANEVGLAILGRIPADEGCATTFSLQGTWTPEGGAAEALDSLHEFEREPVSGDRLQPGKYFAGLFAGEHVAGTEFVIGVLFVKWGAGVWDIFLGLALGKTLSLPKDHPQQDTPYWQQAI